MSETDRKSCQCGHMMFAHTKDGAGALSCKFCDDCPQEVPLAVGDLVMVDDPGLKALRIAMQRATRKSPPNHHGTVAEILDNGMILVEFPLSDGGSQVAPYPLKQVRRRDASNR